MKSAVGRRDRLAIGSFFLALFLLGPVQGGVLYPGLRDGRYGTVLILFFAFFAVASLPFWISVRRSRREPLTWGSRAFQIGTGVILSLDVVWFTSGMIYQLVR
ncbi:MAG TPA: hypothetical protein VJA21_05365 [Verrucomicrobiae bacterium]